MADDFKWDELEAEATVVEEARAIAVYLNPKGDVVIRQQAAYGIDDEDPFVFIPMQRVPVLIARLQVLLRDSKQQEEYALIKKNIFRFLIACTTNNSEVIIRRPIIASMVNFELAAFYRGIA